MSPRRPIDVWPPRRFTGRPGYSGHYFAAMAGAPEDPLRVADRIARRRIAHTVAEETRAKCEELGWSEALDWQRSELNKRLSSGWSELCTSFELIVHTLEGEPQTPALKQLIREARRAAGMAPPTRRRGTKPASLPQRLAEAAHAIKEP